MTMKHTAPLVRRLADLPPSGPARILRFGLAHWDTDETLL